MTDKLCVFCEHLNMDGDTGGEYGEPAKFYCTKDRWAGAKAKRDTWGANEIRIYGNTALDEFRSVIGLAETCPDYSPPVVRSEERS